MQRYAVVDQGVVVNVAVWNGEADWTPDRGQAVPCPDWVSPGCSFAEGAFEAAAEAPAPVEAAG